MNSSADCCQCPWKGLLLVYKYRMVYSVSAVRSNPVPISFILFFSKDFFVSVCSDVSSKWWLSFHMISVSVNIFFHVLILFLHWSSEHPYRRLRSCSNDLFFTYDKYWSFETSDVKGEAPTRSSHCSSLDHSHRYSIEVFMYKEPQASQLIPASYLFNSLCQKSMFFHYNN